MTRAALYLRQSQDREDTRLAVDRQREMSQALCKSRGWDVVHEYTDNDTSATKSRDAAEFAKMVADANAGAFDVVVASEAERLARRLSDIEYLVDAGIIAATAQGDLDLTQPEGEFQANILVSFSRKEARTKAKRQKDQALQAAQLGQPHVGGPRAFAYERDGATIREGEAAALRTAYASLLAGDSLVSITKALAERFTTPSGNPFHRSAARAILLNARNAGIRTYTTKIKGKLVTREIGPALWPPIVDLDTFRAAQALLSDPARRKNRGTARRWLGGGLFLCGVEGCDSDMRVNYRGDVDPDGNAVRVYRCRESAHLSRVADWVDWRVTEHLIAKLSQPYARDLLIDDQREDINDLRRQSALINTRLKQLGEDFAEGTITRETMLAGSARLSSKLADLDGRMQHVDRAPILADLVNADDVRAAWNAYSLDRQRAVIDLLYKVILLPRRPGRFETPIESVIMEPKIKNPGNVT